MFGDEGFRLKKRMSEQNKASLLRRARAKFLSINLSIRLVERNPASFLVGSYRASTYCTQTLLQSGREISSTYCKNRWCAVCNRIRTARLINGYIQPLKALQDPQFVTLTKQTVSADFLPMSIELMNKTWRTILNSREGRKRGLRGVRKIECTVRPNGQYHYHFHVIIDGAENAKWLINEWIKHLGKLVSHKAQDMRPADEGSLKELFKYFTKLTTPDKKLYDLQRMDVIFRALRGKRTYQPFGGIAIVSEEIEGIRTEELDFLSEQEQVWNWHVNDWINDAGEALTGYQPNEAFRQLFDDVDRNIIDQDTNT